jgi:hypothetical protein
MRRQHSIAIGDALLKEFAFWKLQKFPWWQTRLWLKFPCFSYYQ